MSRQFEQSHDSDDREELQDISVLEVCRELLEGQVNVEAKCGDVVDDIDRRFDKFTFVGTGDESHEDLKGEPRVTDALDVEEGDMCVRVRLIYCPICAVCCRFHWDVLYYWYSHVRMGF